MPNDYERFFQQRNGFSFGWSKYALVLAVSVVALGWCGTRGAYRRGSFEAETTQALKARIAKKLTSERADCPRPTGYCRDEFAATIHESMAIDIVDRPGLSLLLPGWTYDVTAIYHLDGESRQVGAELEAPYFPYDWLFGRGPRRTHGITRRSTHWRVTSLELY